MITRSTRGSRAAATAAAGKGIVRFKLNHRPDHKAGRRKDFFQQGELR
jgi:hypothetical protein